MDNFDPSYTPNHDDHMLRYSYRNQPTIIWWNLVRFGEALGELIGAAGLVDDAAFVSEGVKESQQEEIIARAEKLIMQTGDEYKETFLAEYKRLMLARLGLRRLKSTDFDELFSDALDALEAYELDFNHFFRRLSNIRLDNISSHKARKETAAVFFHKEGVVGEDEARERLAKWLDKWRARVLEDWQSDDGGQVTDEERIQSMKRVNPNFVPRGWILDELIRRVEKEGERDVLNRAMHMALNPFEDEWAGRTFNGAVYQGDVEEEQRWVGDVPRKGRAMQCSCSS